MARTDHAENPPRNIGERAIDVLGRQRWLDRPSYRFEHALTFAFAAPGRYRDRLTNALHGTWLGHPVHPALTALPTGAVAATVALDPATVFPGHTPGLRDGARLTLGIGIAGSLAAAATGVTDWQHTHEQSRRIGAIHGLSNAVATGLYAMSWWHRRRGRHLRGMTASAIGYGITLGSGYLGAALVYGEHAGMDHSGARLTIDRWTPTLPLAAVDGRLSRIIEKADDVPSGTPISARRKR